MSFISILNQIMPQCFVQKVGIAGREKIGKKRSGFSRRNNAVQKSFATPGSSKTRGVWYHHLIQANEFKNEKRILIG